MKNKLMPFIFILLAILFTSTVSAKSSNAQSAGTGQGQQAQSQQQVNKDPEVTGNQVQNKNQIRTENKGEETQIQTSNQERESSQSGDSTSSAGKTKSPSPRSEMAQEHMSAVAQKVEELLTTRSAKGGIGQTISEFAQQQVKTQDEVVATVKTLETRPKMLKLFAGPDLKQVQKLAQIREQNQERIQQLEQLKTQITNAGDLKTIEETIQVLTQENNFLQDQIKLEEGTKSLFGWLFKLFK